MTNNFIVFGTATSFSYTKCANILLTKPDPSGDPSCFSTKEQQKQKWINPSIAMRTLIIGVETELFRRDDSILRDVAVRVGVL
jgi:hypothetical protein